MAHIALAFGAQSVISAAPLACPARGDGRSVLPSMRLVKP
jgi:hypothetical protein